MTPNSRAEPVDWLRETFARSEHELVEELDASGRRDLELVSCPMAHPLGQGFRLAPPGGEAERLAPAVSVVAA